ncbi:methionine adenosyltransferase domain-containing protein [Anaerobacillus sp. HL2]|nr:methionine adenosyltransferase domain-containing protein [Anaerobacillus sp. HL2]
MIEKLRLRNSIYSDTATYGHFNSSLFPWENVDFNLNLRKVAERYED